MHFRCDPEPEVIMDRLRLHDEIHDFLDVGETQVTVLEQHPAARRHAVVHETTRVHLLALTHRNGAAFWVNDRAVLIN